MLHDYGIRSHGMFVLGADHDTPDSVRETVRFALENKIDTVMLNILTPLPGTQQYRELEDEGRIIERDWAFYDAQHVVFRPRQMTPLHLLQETLKANRRFYATWRPVVAFHRWLWTAADQVVRKRAAWDRMLEYGWLWYYSRTWWTDAKNRAQRRRLRALSRQAPDPSAAQAGSARQAGAAARRCRPSPVPEPGRTRLPAGEEW